MATLSLSQVKNKQAFEVTRLNEELESVSAELLNRKRSEESLRDQLETLKAMDPVGLQQQLQAAQQELAELQEQQQKFQIERMEAFMAVDAKASQKQEDLKKMAEELRAVKAELKSLKELNPERLRKKVDEQKKKLLVKTAENKKLIGEATGLRNKIRELKKAEQDSSAQSEAATESADAE